MTRLLLRPTPAVVAFVLALAAWGLLEILTRPGPAPAAHHLLLAAVAPLPLLLAGRRPVLAATLVVGLSLLRVGLEVKTVAQSVILLAALYRAEAGRAGDGLPWRGVGLGAVLVGGTALIDLLDVGGSTLPRARYDHLALVVVGAVGAGWALRDRAAETARLEAETARLQRTGDARLSEQVAGERRRIAAEIEAVVKLLLHRVRPLAERSARAQDPATITEAMTAARDTADQAMVEMRRVLALLREDAATATAPVAAPRWGRARRLTMVAAPVLLLGAFGIPEQTEIVHVPHTIYPEGVVIPAPAFGADAVYASAFVVVLPLLARYRWPLLACLGVLGLALARMALDHYSGITFTHFYVAAAAALFGAAHARAAWQVPVAGGAAVATSVTLLWMEQFDYRALDYAFVAVLPLVAMIAGALVRERVHAAGRADRARRAVAAEQERRAAERLEHERLEAARELHDVVGHAVLVIGMQASVAVTLAERDLDGAHEAARTVARVTAAAERDLGRLDAVLGPGEPVGTLPGLVAESGLAVELDDRTEAELPLALAHVVYRLVQEALVNTRRHAGRVPVRVELAEEGGRLVVTVGNGPGAATTAADGGGRGLAGMRERVELYGGAFRAGPRPDGGWVVRADLPLARAEPRVGVSP